MQVEAKTKIGKEIMSTTGVFRRITLGIAFAGLVSGGAQAQPQDRPPQQQDVQRDKKDIRSDKKDLNRDRADRNADQRTSIRTAGRS